MSAPSGTIWGDIVTGSGSGNYRKGKIGIYATITSSTDTVTTIRVQVWFWTIYSCSDSSNNLYFNIGTGVTSATTNVGSASIYHTVDSGEWSTSNQTKILDKSYSYTKGTSIQICNIYAKFNGVDIITGGTMKANTFVEIPALASYTVSYNANGGSGAPANQTKYYGQTLKLSTTIPTRTGYTFKGWSTDKSATSATYSSGGSYTANAKATLYAVWKLNTYIVSYDANGGTGAPANQTKEHGVTLVLSNTIPTRTNYVFKGWSTSSTATSATYSAGGNYTDNAAAKLYAVWELAYTPPLIKGLKANRCNSDGTLNDFGTYAKIQFSWECSQLTGTNNVSSIVIYYKSSSSTNWGNPVTVSATDSGYAGTVRNKVIGGSLDLDTVYNVKVTVKDSLGGETSLETVVSAAKFVIDFLSGGGGVAFGKPASRQDAAEFNFDIRADKDIYDKYGTIVRNGVAIYSDSNGNTFDANTTNEHCIVTSTNAPTASNHYVITYFYSDKSGTKNRTQIALPYRTSGAMYHRFYNNGAWSSWKKNVYSDELSAYVVEEGTSNGWGYRKWSNGVAECWYNKTINGFACNTALTTTPGSWYRTGEITANAYPLTFSSTPNLQTTFETFSGTGGLVWSCGTSSSTPKTKPANIYIIRMSSAASISGVVHYYAIGNY